MEVRYRCFRLTKRIYDTSGLSFIAMSQKAWEASEKSNLPKFYLNLQSYKKSLTNNSNPYTPAVNLVFALDEALKMMKKKA